MLAAPAAGRGQADLPLVGVGAPGFGPRPVDPSDVSARELLRVAAALLALPGVTRLHDLHIWAMSTTEPVLTAHLLMPGGPPGDAFLADARDMLRRDFSIGHATLQVERGADCVVDC